MTKTYYVYILSGPNGAGLYVDISRSLGGYKIDMRHPRALVHYETYSCLAKAVSRAETLKRWPVGWVTSLINEKNPHWQDLAQGNKLAA